MKENIVGPRIKQARLSEKPKASQSDISARMEVLGVYVSSYMISKMERQLRPVTDIQLMAFAKALRVTPQWLLCES